MTLEQTINPSIPLTGLGYNPIQTLYGQQLTPQGPIGNLPWQLGPLAPYAVHPHLAAQSPIGAILSQLGPLTPFGQQFGQAHPIASLLAQSQGPFGQQFGQAHPIASLLAQSQGHPLLA